MYSMTFKVVIAAPMPECVITTPKLECFITHPKHECINEIKVSNNHLIIAIVIDNGLM